MSYRTGFQCPETGLYVVATYAFGKVHLRLTEYTLEDMPDETTQDTLDALINQTEAYCRRYTNKRCKSIDDADDYIVRVSDGEIFGFER